MQVVPLESSADRSKPPRMTAYGGGFNRSMQHTDHCVSRRSVADEVPRTHLLHGRPEGLDVGAMEGRLDAAPDCSSVQSRAYLGSRRSGSDRRHSTTATEPFCDRVETG